MKGIPMQARLSLLGFAMLASTGYPSEVQAADMSRLCEVDQVAVLSNRIHIKCAIIEDKAFTRAISYYAMALREPAAKITGIIELATTAKQIRKPLVIWFDMDDYKSVPGCLGHDCRVMSGAALE